MFALQSDDRVSSFPCAPTSVRHIIWKLQELLFFSMCVQGLSGHTHIGPAALRDSISCVCFRVSVPRGSGQHALRYLRKIISLRKPKVASPAAYYGQFIYKAGSRRFIGNGKIQSSGCYCTDVTQNYWRNSFPNKLLSVMITLNLFQQRCARSDSFQICGEIYSAFLK